MRERGQPLTLPGGLFPVHLSAHDAYKAIAAEQRRGILKRCAHLSVCHVGATHGVYQIVCERDSFEPTKELPPKSIGGCPKDCRLYQAPWRARISRWRRNQHPLIWFERQPWQVKVALIAVPLLIVAGYFGVMRDLATLVRAIGEVWRGK